MRGVKIQKFKGKGKQPYRWRVRAPNGRIILASEGYTSSSSRDRVVDSFVERMTKCCYIVEDLENG